ncbi:ABC transporter permease [Patiriisocius marinus]|uniref:ABC transporter permease n=1 Tax=Patiriisocius marinus TaxID=1397112 RepID=UPI00232F2B33|nr:ABC-2 transporter permease [Patiriisocius marinus]
MHKIWVSAIKEYKLLSRDLGGIAILFLMPLALLLVITLIQDSSFKAVNSVKIPILLVDNDQGEVAASIREGLSSSDAFAIVQEQNAETAKAKVFNGDYQLAIVIPATLSQRLATKVNDNVERMLAAFGLEEAPSMALEIEKVQPIQVTLYFDPATQGSFKNQVKSGIDKMISKIETQTIYKAFQEQLGEEDQLFETEPFITFKEVTPTNGEAELIPNSAQHNVPAWALFAIFFIIVPLSINMVKEKNQGTFVRLRTQPVSYATVLGGKTIVYLAVCLIQFALMLLVGLFVFPLLGLPVLDVSGKLPMLFLVAFFAGLAAIGLGLLLGTIAKTQEQAAPFGATFVVILAALGGVWVPVFIMPKFMQQLSNISPMNWGLEGFYDVFLRNASVLQVLPEISLLFLFFLVTLLISILYNEKKHAV